jgi:hypothetical protein
MPADPPPFLGSASDLTPQRLRGTRYRRQTRDVYVLATREQSLDLRCRSLLLVLPDAVLSHQTAAAVLGLPGDIGPQVHVTRPPGSSASERPGVRTHRRPVDDGEVVERRGLRVTSPVRTWLDLAAVLPPVPLVALGDAVARRTGIPALQAAVDGAGRRRGVVRARAALPLIDPGADSPSETRARLLLHEAGFRGLRHGVRILDEDGGWVATADLADPVARVAVQYDGLVHLDGGPEQWRRDIDRDEMSRAAGWEVVVLTAYDLRRQDVAIAKLAAAYARAAARR